jgi:hypothetical protein
MDVGLSVDAIAASTNGEIYRPLKELETKQTLRPGPGWIMNCDSKPT